MGVRKVTVTLTDELYELVERARAVEHRSRSGMIQEAIRTHFGEAVYRPTDDEREKLLAALDQVENEPQSLRDWGDVRRELWADR